MVSQKSISYADRAKSGPPRSSPTTTAKASTPVAVSSDASPAPLTPGVLSNKEAAQPRAAAEPTPNGVDASSTPGSTNDHHHQPATQISPPPPSAATVNGFSSSAATADLSLPSSTPTTKQPNVWTVRKEQMNAARSAPQTATSASSQSQSYSQPPTSHPSHSSSTSASSPSQSDMKSQVPLSSDSARAPIPAPPPMQPPTSTSSTGQSSKFNKKRAQNSKPVTNAAAVVASSSTAPPPPFNEKSSWPAPSEAVASPVNGIASTTKKDGQGTEEEGKQGPPSHSRESSSTGTGGHGGHGKKQQWVKIPASELAAATEAAQANGSHYSGNDRGRRLPEGDVRRNGGRIGQGPNRSGHNSKRSSAAASPLMQQHLPLAPSSTTPTLNANATPFSSRNLVNLLNAPVGPPAPGGRKSHPHSPMSRSPFLSSHSQSLINSPRAGYGGSPKGTYQQQHPLPPNPLRQQYQQEEPPQPARNKVHRPSPSKSSAIGGEIPAIDPAYRPVFGSIEPTSDVGLGLMVESEGGKAQKLETGDAPEVVEEGTPRWTEPTRRMSKAEKIMKAQGKLGFGVEPQGLEGLVQGPGISDEAGQPSPALEDLTQSATEPPSPKPTWSFGSLDEALPDPSIEQQQAADMLVVDPSRRPPYAVPYTEGSAPSGINGYAPYSGGSPQSGSRTYGEERRVSPVEGQGQAGYPEGGANGYTPRGFGGGRRGGRGRGGYGGRGGGYGARPPNPGYRNGIVHPQQQQQCPAPPPQGLYQYSPHYDISMAAHYPPPPMPGVDYYAQMDPYAQPNVAPQTPNGSQQPLVPADAPYSPHTGYAGYAGYPPPMPGMPYPPPMAYYPPYGVPGGPNGMPPMYPMPAYPPPAPYPAAPPMPAPVTNVGYALDQVRYTLLGQVEYYFSPQNLTQDVFLRKNMDPQGWVDINKIASFNRVRSLTGDLTLVREMMAISAILEVSPDGEKCRMANNTWEPWVLPPGSSDPQTHTPQFQYQPQQPWGDTSQEHFIPVDSANSSGEGAALGGGTQENTSTESVIIIS